MAASDYEFQDPLENYDPDDYSDKLEQALAEKTAADIRATPFVTTTPDTPVQEALERLAGQQLGCVLVEQEGKLVGVFTDRDTLDRVALEHEEMLQRPVRDVMATAPVFVYETDSAAAVLHVMAVSGYRHVPILRQDGSIVGVASPQRMTGFLREAYGRE